MSSITKMLRPVLIGCVSMRLNNRLCHQISEADILQEPGAVLQLSCDMVLIHNEVGPCVIAVKFFLQCGLKDENEVDVYVKVIF
jgi:adenosylcobinamide kinase/adenosylcobinamide-phosphate guanylyltransferase